MRDATRHRLVWGWLRVLLGIAQVVLASAGLILVLTIGFHPLTCIVAAGATLLTIVSRILYRGRPDPKLE